MRVSGCRGFPASRAINTAGENAVNKTILAILALCLTAGCSTGKIITTVNSMPGAVEKLKT